MKMNSKNDHDLTISKEVERLRKLGYLVQREYEILLGGGQKRGYRLMVDIYAKRGSEELLIEVGTLSQNVENRLNKLKKLKPDAKVIHITQWKNFGTSQDHNYKELSFEEKDNIREKGKTIR